MAIGHDRTVKFQHALGSHALGTLEEIWIEATISVEWKVAYRVLQQEGRMVIGELRIFPNEGDGQPVRHQRPGEWSGTRAGLKASAPAGGITTRLLRNIPVASDFAEGLKASTRYLRLVKRARPRLRAAGFRAVKRQRVGTRRGWSDEDLLSAAALYATAGSHPVTALAAAWRLDYGKARDLLTTATEKGFLTKGRQGRASKALTVKAEALLKKKEQGQ